jgi:hypothetical protein
MMYCITGIDRRGRRFAPITTSSLFYALGHNIWQGTLWRVENGKRSRIHIWYN